MVTYTVNAGTDIWDIRGLAAEKEAFAAQFGVPNGSTYYEIDGEHNVYMYDREHMAWVLQ